MTIYWRLRSVPELACLAPGDRKRVHEACLRLYFWRAPITLKSLCAYLMLILCPVTVFLLTTWVVSAIVGSTPFWLSILVLVIGGVFGRFAFSRIAVSHLRQYYPDYIRNQNFVNRDTTSLPMKNEGA